MQTQKVIDHIVNWLSDYAKNAGVKGFVVGISGGIDSAVVSALCARTGLNTLCAEMPIHQAQSQVNRGRQHIKALSDGFKNVSNIEVDLTTVFDAFERQVPTDFVSAKLQLSLANSRSRLRMTALYYLAGVNHLLVAGTGNKIEDFGVGFFTKYGDGGVDISPIADLMKSEVYQLGKGLNISSEIMAAPPTDGLFGDSRTDEDQLGANYDELEWAMQMAEKGHITTDFEGRKKMVFDIYSKLNRANRHKIEPIPICIIPTELK